MQRTRNNPIRHIMEVKNTVVKVIRQTTFTRYYCHPRSLEGRISTKNDEIMGATGKKAERKHRKKWIDRSQEGMIKYSLQLRDTEDIHKYRNNDQRKINGHIGELVLHI